MSENTELQTPMWAELALVTPEFVQWAVQTHGPLPDGPIQEDLYIKLSDAYVNR